MHGFANAEWRDRENTLSFFAEIRNAQALRGLVLSLLFHAGDDEHDQRDDVRKHLVELLEGEVHACRDVQVEDIKAAEQDRGESVV